MARFKGRDARTAERPVDGAAVGEAPSGATDAAGAAAATGGAADGAGTFQGTTPEAWNAAAATGGAQDGAAVGLGTTLRLNTMLSEAPRQAAAL